MSESLDISQIDLQDDRPIYNGPPVRINEPFDSETEDEDEKPSFTDMKIEESKQSFHLDLSR
jgi:hypothetical protein